MPDTSTLRAQPGARMGTPLCRFAVELAALQGWRRYGTAFLLGAALAAALPPVDLTPLVFAIFPLYLWLDEGSATPWAAARLGFVFAVGHFAAGVYWIAAALFVDIGRFWWALPFALFGTPAVLSVFVAVCLYGAALARQRFRLSAVGRVCLFAVAWSLSEWLRGHLFTGFPWNLIGYVWAGGFPGALAMLQTTAWVGVYGLGFMTVLSASLLALLGTPSLAPLGTARRTLPAAVAALLIGVPFAAGAIRLQLAPTVETSIWLRLVQPSIPQTGKWDPAQAAANFRRLIELSTAPAAHKLAAVIWPEAAATFLLERDEAHRMALAAAAPAGGYLITGALSGKPLTGPLQVVWNSVEAIDPAGKIVAAYNKAHLVPFGEYMPFDDVLPLKKFTPGAMDLSAGPGPETLSLAGLPPFDPLICYEAIFPAAIVDPQHRPQWLLNVSNDAWYGRSSGPYQHFDMARVRAVEEGLPLVRVGNNGITGVVDPEGRVRASTKLDEITYADVVLPAAAAPTPYSRVGDWPFFAMLLLSVAAAAAPSLRRQR
jgi:apolipoprotein N-acyltransferase